MTKRMFQSNDYWFKQSWRMVFQASKGFGGRMKCCIVSDGLGEYREVLISSNLDASVAEYIVELHNERIKP